MEKYKQAKQRIRQTSKNRLEALEHKTTKEVVLFLEKENVTNVVIGKVSGIQKKHHEKRNKRITK